jgi:hypothetical protein
MSVTEPRLGLRRGAILDDAHIGDIRGAFGTIPHGDIAPRRGGWRRLRTLLAILGPGLIVMVGAALTRIHPKIGNLNGRNGWT